ncbi:MAG: MFS transporter [Jiangellaceae bacterium]
MTSLRATFASLSTRNYRLFFTGQTISVMGTWMQKIAQAWLVLELTGSGTLLGITAALQQLPTLLVGPWAGLLADRVDKRKLLIWTQATAAVPAVLLGVLIATDRVQLWMVLVLALCLGTIGALDKPARHTFVIEMVGPSRLTNAVTLNSIVINAGKVTGPAIGGVLIATVGLAPSFMINSVSYLAVVTGLLLMRTDQLQPAPPMRRGRGQLRDGLRYVRRSPQLLGPLVLMTVTGMLAYEWAVTLPLFARDTFDADAQAFGLMFSAMGVGAVIGGLSIASTLHASARMLTSTALVFAALMVATAFAPTLLVAFVALFAVGGASLAFRAVANSLIQLQADPQMRGRVMALLVVATTGTTPVGGPLVGWIGETFGARVSLAAGGIATAVAAGATYAYLRRRGLLRPPVSPAATVPALATRAVGQVR